MRTLLALFAASAPAFAGEAAKAAVESYLRVAAPSEKRMSVAIPSYRAPPVYVHWIIKVKEALGERRAAVVLVAGIVNHAERHAAGMDARKGSVLKLSGSFGKWGHARQLGTFWSSRLKERIDEAHRGE